MVIKSYFRHHRIWNTVSLRRLYSSLVCPAIVNAVLDDAAYHVCPITVPYAPTFGCMRHHVKKYEAIHATKVQDAINKFYGSVVTAVYRLVVVGCRGMWV